MSQILENPEAFKAIAQEALDICHFKHDKETCTKACYECLLSYQNQLDHAVLDRHVIRAWLEELASSTLERHAPALSREDQYQQLLAQTDPDSEFERIVLAEIYQLGLKLPNAAQELIPEADIKPDFIYHKERVAVFCDGSAHDSPTQRQQDKIDRDNLRYISNYYVLTLRHDEDWRSKLPSSLSF